MDFHEGVTSRLLGNAAVKQIVDKRVNWMERPQREKLPAITLQVVSDPRPSHLKGPEGARSTRLQIDCWAKTSVEAIALAKAATDALRPPATINGKKFGTARIDAQRDLGETVGSGTASQSGGTLIHRQSVDLIIRHVGD